MTAPTATTPDDCSWGAFIADGPWTLDRSTIRWLPLAGKLRSAAQAEVPGLTKPSKLPPGLRVVTVVGVLGKALLPWWVRKKRGRFATPEASRADVSLRLRKAAERLGPTYIKLGQIISSGEGLFPAELVGEFKKCRDQVPAEPFDTVRLVVEADRLPVEERGRSRRECVIGPRDARAVRCHIIDRHRSTRSANTVERDRRRTRAFRGGRCRRIE